MSTVTNDKPTAPAKTPMRKAQVLDYLHIKGSTLGDWVRLRGFPKPVRPTPNTPYWFKEDVDAWLSQTRAG
ncbi:helix-turn-helix transcriptional regulator [Parasutterella excrementihominis]|jgi:predicted DNA-binding transcriptional regulator AlpA|uniref:helix-turn-helix transcriptional regulator n=1 Tax=Parasutterella excrementihominis TaxID=487175 RepID=UPI003AF514DD